MPELHIAALGPEDAEAVVRLLTADPPEYRKYFDPFPPEAEAVRETLAAAKSDRFWGVVVDEQLAALVLLRGLDAGFAAPAFGVYVGQSWTGCGLATLALQLAETWCKLNSRAELMLTVHPANEPAARIYERAGFTFSGEHSDKGHRIYRKRVFEVGRRA